jgi:Ser-tRNA(Ala) deacylase AlaX
MPVTFAFEAGPYRRELITEVMRTGDHAGRPYAVLADTVLYPEGGGQPADRGWIGENAVADVQRIGGEILHLLEAPVAMGAVTVRLDWERRYDHMQQHTAQHLLTALAAERFGWRTTAFHLGASVSDIELDAPSLATDRLDALEEAVAAEIRAARPVSARFVTREEYAALAVRSRGLPEGLAGDIRLVEIVGTTSTPAGARTSARPPRSRPGCRHRADARRHAAALGRRRSHAPTARRPRGAQRGAARPARRRRG